MPPNRSASATVGVAIRSIVTSTLLAYLFSRYDVASQVAGWTMRVAVGVACAFLTLILAQFLSAVRWHLVLSRDAPTLRELFRIYMVGVFFSLFLPTSVGGDAVRALGLTRVGVSASRAASSVVLDRVLGVIALGGLLLVGLVAVSAAPGQGLARTAGLSVELPPLPLIGVGLVLGGGATLVAVWRVPRLRAVLVEASTVWAELAGRPARLTAALVIALGVQAAYLAAWAQLAWSLQLPVPSVGLLVYVPLVSLAAMVPVTVSGLGIREGAWALLLAPYGVGTGDAAGYGLLYFLAFALVGALGGLSLVAVGRPREASVPGNPHVTPASDASSTGPNAVISRG